MHQICGALLWLCVFSQTNGQREDEFYRKYLGIFIGPFSHQDVPSLSDGIGGQSYTALLPSSRTYVRLSRQRRCFCFVAQMQKSSRGYRLPLKVVKVSERHRMLFLRDVLAVRGLTSFHHASRPAVKKRHA